MNANEKYLDQLLKAMGDEMPLQEETASMVEDPESQKSEYDGIFTEAEKMETARPESVPTRTSSAPRKEMSDDAIAAFFAAANVAPAAEESVVETDEPADVEEYAAESADPEFEDQYIEESIEEPLSEMEPEPIAEADPVAEVELIAEPESAPTPLYTPNDDPSHVMTPDEIAALLAASEPIEQPETTIEPETVVKPEPELIAEPEPAPAYEMSDDPNHVMTPDEIAALLAAQEPAAEPEPEPEVIAEPEPAPAYEMSDDPNHVMTPDEIAALLAAQEPAADPEPEPEVIAEPEPVPAYEMSDDPNHVMTPDEIAALLAAQEPAAEPEPEPAPAYEMSDDPNHVMTPDEIAALLAAQEPEAEPEPESATAPEFVEDSIPDEVRSDFGDLDNFDEILNSDADADYAEIPDLEEIGAFAELNQLSDLPDLDAEISQSMDGGDSDQMIPDFDGSIQFDGTEPDGNIEMSSLEMPEDTDLADLLSAIPELDDGENSLSAMDMNADSESLGDLDADMLSELSGADEDIMSLLESAESEFDDLDSEQDEPIDFFAENSDMPEMSSAGGGFGGDGSASDDVPAEKPKKKSIFARLAELFKGSDSEDDEDETEKSGGVESGDPAVDENIAILQELDREEVPKKKVDKKKEKKKKEKKPKPKKEKKAKKPKPKKEKKPKEVDNTPPGKRISKKFIIALTLVCASFVGLLIFALNFLPSHAYAKQAREAFGRGDYEEVYETLVGLDLEGDEKDLYNKSFLLMKMKRLVTNAQNLQKEGDVLGCLNALIKSVDYYDKTNATAEAYGVLPQMNEYYSPVKQGLAGYDLTEDDARAFAKIGDPVRYSMALEDYLYGPSSVEPNIPEEILNKYKKFDEPEEEEYTEPEEKELYDWSVDATGTEDEESYDPDDEDGEDSDYRETGDGDSDDGAHGNDEYQEDETLFEFGVTQDKDGNYHAGN